MSDGMAGHDLWAIVKFDLSNRRFEKEFHDWYNDTHLPELVAREGFSAGWRTGELQNAPNVGPAVQEFWAIYAVDDAERFRPFAEARAQNADVLAREVFRPDMANWGRTFYRLIGHVERDDALGGCWAREEFVFRGAPSDREGVEEALRLRLEKIAATAGVHRAWQFRMEPDDLEIGEQPESDYMNIYEIDAPETFIAGRDRDPDLNDQRVPVERQLHFAEKLHDLSR